MTMMTTHKSCPVCLRVRLLSALPSLRSLSARCATPAHFKIGRAVKRGPSPCQRRRCGVGREDRPACAGTCSCRPKPIHSHASLSLCVFPTSHLGALPVDERWKQMTRPGQSSCCTVQSLTSVQCSAAAGLGGDTGRSRAHQGQRGSVTAPS